MNARRSTALAAVAASLAAAAPAAEAAFPGRNGRIAFDSSTRIYTVTPAGRGLDNVGRGIMPAFSPDGKLLLFGDNTGRFVNGVGESQIFRSGANGRARAQVTTGPTSTESAAWSADGTRIAYRDVGNDEVEDREPGTPIVRDGIYVRALAGGPATFLAGGFAPSWSTTNRIAYQGLTQGSGIVHSRPDGTGLTRVTRRGDNDPDWSPTGSRIAFSREVVSRTTGRKLREDIYTVGAGGGKAKLVIRNGTAPVYSPDGKWIAFQRQGETRSGRLLSRVLVVRASGRGLERVVTDRQAFEPSWQPRR